MSQTDQTDPADQADQPERQRPQAAIEDGFLVVTFPQEINPAQSFEPLRFALRPDLVRAINELDDNDREHLLSHIAGTAYTFAVGIEAMVLGKTIGCLYDRMARDTLVDSVEMYQGLGLFSLLGVMGGGASPFGGRSGVQVVAVDGLGGPVDLFGPFGPFGQYGPGL